MLTIPIINTHIKAFISTKVMTQPNPSFLKAAHPSDPQMHQTPESQGYLNVCLHSQVYIYIFFCLSCPFFCFKDRSSGSADRAIRWVVVAVIGDLLFQKFFSIGRAVLGPSSGRWNAPVFGGIKLYWNPSHIRLIGSASIKDAVTYVDRLVKCHAHCGNAVIKGPNGE